MFIIILSCISASIVAGQTASVVLAFVTYWVTWIALEMIKAEHRKQKMRRELHNACADMTGDLRTVSFFEYIVEKINYRMSRIVKKQVK